MATKMDFLLAKYAPDAEEDLKKKAKEDEKAEDEQNAQDKEPAPEDKKEVPKDKKKKPPVSESLVDKYM